MAGYLRKSLLKIKNILVAIEKADRNSPKSKQPVVSVVENGFLIIFPKLWLRRQKKHLVTWNSIKKIWAVKYDVYIGEIFGVCVLDESGDYTRVFSDWKGYVEFKKRIFEFTEFNKNNYDNVYFYRSWGPILCWARGEKVEDINQDSQEYIPVKSHSYGPTICFLLLTVLNVLFWFTTCYGKFIPHSEGPSLERIDYFLMTEIGPFSWLYFEYKYDMIIYGVITLGLYISSTFIFRSRILGCITCIAIFLWFFMGFAYAGFRCT